MKISIVIPTFNSEEYLLETLNSLKVQTYSNFEVIVSDGLSTDKTLSIVNDFKSNMEIKIRSSEDCGMYDALNKGFDLASGEVYCYLNSDDLYEPDTLMLISSAFKNSEYVDFVYGNMNMLLGDKVKRIYYPPLIKNFFTRVSYSMFGQPSTFWRATLHRKVGGFNGDLKMAGDYDFFCKCLDFRILKLDNILSSFRLHKDSLTSNNHELSLKEMKLIQSKIFEGKQGRGLSILGDLYFKSYNVLNRTLKSIRS